MDQALLALFEERARLCRTSNTTSAAAVEDLLRRASGDLDADSLRKLFAVLEHGCGSDGEVNG